MKVPWMSSTLMALQPPAAARTAGASRGVGSGRSHRQLQAQIHRLHLHGGLGAAAQGRPSGPKGAITGEGGGQKQQRTHVEIRTKRPT